MKIAALRHSWLLIVAATLSGAPVQAQVVHVLPYVQPGDGHALSGADVKVIRWLTDQTPGDFAVEYEDAAAKYRPAKVTRIALDFATMKSEAGKKPAAEPKKLDPKDPEAKAEPKVPLPPEKEQRYFRYTANLEGLPFNREIHYRVKLGAKVIREASFRTRASADQSVRCALVGDLAQGRPSQNSIAFEISKQKPEFLVALGDIVYPTGRVNQYMAYFWGTYNNAAKADPKSGAPLMANVPFYPVLGNHDVKAKLDKTPDALAVYYFFAPPKHGPGLGPWTTPLGAEGDAAAQFRAATEDSYPFIDTYSFDNGPGHFVVVNGNRSLADESLHKWLRSDLNATTAKWKIVCFHMPGFHSSKQHYAEQQARHLQPILEQCGVDLCFSGHVHNYQRTVPLKFSPGKDGTKKLVNGVFSLDTVFDGVKNTTPKGVIHVVAGGGGASLYGPGLDKTADMLKSKYGANYAPYTAKLVADRHSFVMLDLAPAKLELQAISLTGEVLDRLTITK